MTCPNCQTICGEADRFCFRCGARLSAEHTKKGTHIVPILILILLSALGIVLFFMIPMENPVSETPWFFIENGTLYFDESLYAGSSELVIPETVDGQTVLHIGDWCFENNTWLTTVILPDTVQSIGRGAFSNCVFLRGIHLPEGLTDIGSEAFLYCTALEAITVPSTTEHIGQAAFEGCGKLFHIFYSGEYSRWYTLYSWPITSHTYIYCTDGSFLHR